MNAASSRAVWLGAVLAMGLSVLPAVALAQASASPYTTGFRYDLSGRLVGQIAPDPDGAGPLGHAAIRNTYDALGNLIKIESGDLASWQSEAVSPSSWSGFAVLQTIEIGYDSMGRESKRLLRAGGAIQTLTQRGYDPFGRLECTTVRMNPATFATPPASACALGTAGSFGPDRITRTHYDSRDRVLKVQRAVGTALQQDHVAYTYEDITRTPATVTDANGNIAAMTYDAFGRRLSWHFPSKTTPGAVSSSDYEQYAYDGNGNRTWLRKRDGHMLSFSYDALDRLTLKNLPGTASDVFYGYDLRGLRVFARFGSVTGAGVSTGYDGFGRVTSSGIDLDGVVRTLSYEYDGNGNRTRITHPDGVAFEYGYDGLNRLVSISEPGGVTAATLVYDRHGRRQSFGRGGAGSTTYVYDGASRLSGLGQDLAGSADDLEIDLAYSPANQIVTRSLSNTGYGWWPASSRSDGYAINGLNQYTAIGGKALSYDGNGNLTADGARSYGYDAENRLIGAEGDVSATLSYDPLGRLYQTTINGETTRFLYDGDALVAEYDGAGTVQRRYVHGPGVDEPIAEYVGATVGASSRRYLYADHQGSIVAVSSGSGALLSANSYDAYGVAGADNAGRFAYTGQIALPELGLYHYKARAYDPSLGRFLQTDPIGYEDQMNLYAYVGNDPLNLVDPSGQFIETAFDVISLAIGVVSFVDNVRAGNFGAAAVDAAGIVVDSVAAAVPFVPGGAGAAIKAGRGIEAAVDASRLPDPGPAQNIVAKSAKDLKPTLTQENPRNLIPTQTTAEMSGSQVKRLTKDMKQNGFDQSKPVDASRNPNTGRLEIQDGHHRTEAAKKAGLDKIPVQVWR